MFVEDNDDKGFTSLFEVTVLLHPKEKTHLIYMLYVLRPPAEMCNGNKHTGPVLQTITVISILIGGYLTAQ